MKNVILAVMAFLSLSASAVRLPSVPVTMQIKNAGLREVLELLMEEGGLNYVIDGKITNATKLDFEVRRVAWSQVFGDVIEQSGLTYTVDRFGKLHIRPK